MSVPFFGVRVFGVVPADVVSGLAHASNGGRAIRPFVSARAARPPPPPPTSGDTRECAFPVRYAFPVTSSRRPRSRRVRIGAGRFRLAPYDVEVTAGPAN